MSEDSINFNEDPQKVFVNLVLQMVKGLYMDLFERKADDWCGASVRRLRGIILTLSRYSKGCLKEELLKVQKMEDGRMSKTAPAIEEIYSLVTDYLHETYFKETFGIKFRNPHPRKLGESSDDTAK